MYVCPKCEQPINQASELCPYCGADLTPTPEDESGQPAKKKNPLRIVLLWGVLLGCLWAVVWFSLPLRYVNPAAQAESRARDALADVHSALATYAASEGTFPDSLEVLGARVRNDAQWAQSAGYILDYSAAAPGPDGRVQNYSLTARPGNYGYLNYFTDSTGVLRSTRENRPATALDPPL
ncbi:MAG: hypothetical protein ACRD50_08000 [Candidatus Acidiferrales bacterium]